VVLALAVVMAAMVVLTLGPALAKDTQQRQTYVDTVQAEQYFALPGSGQKVQERRTALQHSFRIHRRLLGWTV
jgi:hypothetical protein